MKRIWILLASACLCGLLACGGEGEAPAKPSAPSRSAATPKAAKSAADAVAEAEKVFATRCATCHGPQGAGDGPTSAGLTPKPRNFRDPTWQAQISDEDLAKIIKFGGAAVGKSPTMPGNPDLMGQPEVVAALVVHIRELEKP